LSVVLLLGHPLHELGLLQYRDPLIPERNVGRVDGQPDVESGQDGGQHGLTRTLSLLFSLLVEPHRKLVHLHHAGLVVKVEEGFPQERHLVVRKCFAEILGVDDADIGVQGADGHFSFVDVSNVALVSATPHGEETGEVCAVGGQEDHAEEAEPVGED